jgi:DNA-directed RNA polymerase specialized sigma24 family protein
MLVHRLRVSRRVLPRHGASGHPPRACGAWYPFGVNGPRVRFDAPASEALAIRVARGDAAAFGALVEHLWPEWLDLLAASRSMRGLGRDEDHARNVAARLLAKLQKDEFRALRQFEEWRERHPDKSFHDWLRIVVTNAARDYVRERRGSLAAPAGADEPTAKQLLEELARAIPLEELGARPAMTAAQTARELLEFAKLHLQKPQVSALVAWLEGSSFQEMQTELGLRDLEEARRLLRAAVATLRRAFADADAGVASDSEGTDEAGAGTPGPKHRRHGHGGGGGAG